MKTMPFIKDMPVFKGLKTATELALMSPDERDTYMWEFDAHRTDLAAYDYAIKEGFAEGEAKGLAEGEAKGLAKGLAEGEAKGRAAAMRETAQNLKKAGLDIQFISQTTGLTAEEIEGL